MMSTKAQVELVMASVKMFTTIAAAIVGILTLVWVGVMVLGV